MVREQQSDATDEGEPTKADFLASTTAVRVAWITSALGLVGVLAGIVIPLLLQSGNTLPKPSRAEAKPAPPPPAELVHIDYSQRRGSFVIIGSDQDGVFADSGYVWNEIDIVVENNCKERIYVQPGYFRLYIGPRPTTEGAQAYMSTNEGLEYQPNRLSPCWLEPNSKVSCRLIFEVKRDPEEAATGFSKYRILRFIGPTSCQVDYKPY
jgi:hypothetical protein